jgi:hypothetical protein
MASTATDTHTAGAIPLRRCGKKKTPAGLTTHSAKNTDFDELAHSFLVGRHPPVRMRMPHAVCRIWQIEQMHWTVRFGGIQIDT